MAHDTKHGLKPKTPHVLRWVREQLGLRQSDVARLIGSAQPTIQAIELGRLKLSERFAYKLQARLGIDAKWLLANDWQTLPDPTELKKDYLAFQGIIDQTYGDLIQMRHHLLRSYLLLRAIVDELGWHGYTAAGFDKIYNRALQDLLDTIGDKTLRDRVFQDFINKWGEPVKNMASVISDAREIQRALKEHNSLYPKTGK